MYFHLSSQRKQQAALPCSASSPTPRPQLCCTQSHCFEKQHGFVWITLLSFKGQGSRAPALAKLTDQLCLTLELQNLSQVPGCKTTSDKNRAKKVGQWEDKGAEMGLGSSCRDWPGSWGCRASSAAPRAAAPPAPKSGWTRAESNCFPHSFWQPRDALDWHGHTLTCPNIQGESSTYIKWELWEVQCMHISEPTFNLFKITVREGL